MRKTRKTNQTKHRLKHLVSILPSSLLYRKQTIKILSKSNGQPNGMLYYFCFPVSLIIKINYACERERKREMHILCVSFYVSRLQFAKSFKINVNKQIKFKKLNLRSTGENEEKEENKSRYSIFYNYLMHKILNLDMTANRSYRYDSV